MTADVDFKTENFLGKEVRVEAVVLTPFEGTCVDVNASGIVLQTTEGDWTGHRFIPYSSLTTMNMAEPKAESPAPEQATTAATGKKAKGKKQAKRKGKAS